MNSVFDFFDRFIVLSTPARSLLAGLIEEIKVRKGTIIVKEGFINPYMYIIKKGVARGFSFEKGEAKTLSLWDENSSFGDITSYITQDLAIKSYELLEDSVLYKVDSQDFREQFTANIEMANLGRVLVEKYVVSQEMSKRLYLDKTARQRFEIFLQEKPGLVSRVKSIYIASYLGFRPETFTRIRTAWLREQSLS